MIAGTFYGNEKFFNRETKRAASRYGRQGRNKTGGVDRQRLSIKYFKWYQIGFRLLNEMF